MNFQSIEYAPISIRNAGTLKCSYLQADNIIFDDVIADDLKCNSIESKTYTENLVPGTLVKVKNTGTYIIGAGTGDDITTAPDNILIGNNVGTEITNAQGNVYIGDNAGEWTDASFNTFIGKNAGTGEAPLSTSALSTNNVCVGFESGALMAGESKQNTCIGYRAGNSLYNSNRNVFIGNNSKMFNEGTPLNDNICIGFSCQTNHEGSILIGKQLSSTTIGQIVIGSTANTSMVNNIDANCDLGTISKRYKDLHLYGNINNVLPTGGMFSATADSALINAASGKVTMIPTGVGIKNVVENTYKVGDTFSFTMGGIVTPNVADTLGITMSLGATDLCIVILPLETQGASVFRIEGDYTFRNIGPTSSVRGHLTVYYLKTSNNSWRGVSGTITGNVNTGFIEPIDLQAEIVGIGGSTIQTTTFTLNKTY